MSRRALPLTLAAGTLGVLCAGLLADWFVARDSGAAVSYWPLAVVATVALVAVWGLSRSDRSLRASEARQRGILESARDAIITVDDQSRVVALNRAAEELFGYARGDMVGESIDMIFSPAMLPAVHAGRAHYRETGDTPALGGRLEFNAVRADGSEFPAEFTFSQVADVAPALVTVCVRDITERKRAADALRRSAERFRTIIETSSEMVSIMAEDGTFLYTSASVRPVLGYESAELVGTNGYDLIHPDDLAGTREQLALGMEPRSSRTGTFRARHKDGSWRIIEYATRNLVDDPDVRGIVYFSRDVTERQRAECEVRLLESVEAAIAAAPDGPAACAAALQSVCETLGWAVGEVWTPSADGTALDRALVWHAAGAGSERFAAAGQSLRLSRHTGLAGLAWTQRRAQYASDLDASPELRRRVPTAECGLHAALAVPVLAEDRPLAVLLLFTHAMAAGDERPIEMVAARLGELLQRRHAEDARRASEALNRAVLSSLGAHIAVLDRNGVVIAVNDAWRRFALANGDQSGGRLTGVGMNYLDICAAAAADPYARAALHGIRDVLRGKRTSYSLEYPCPAADGERRWFDLVVNPLLGEQRGAVLSHTDVSERKRAEEALIAARESALEVARMRDEFLANLSHELRTPMTAIIGMNMLALETDMTPEQREYLDVVRSSSAALLELINDLLDFSRIDAGKLRIEHVEFDLRRTVGEAMKALGVRAHRGLEIAWEVGADVPDALVGDPGRLRQILANLVGNAIKFTPRGEVVVRVAQEAAQCGLVLRVSVSDTGIGIPPEKQRRIFEPFVQGDGSSTRRYGGTGIGLAITARLVELMGGTMRVESEVGRGSTFHFTVPVGIGERARSPLRLAEAKIAWRRALVVAGNVTVGEILSAMLRGWRLRPLVVADHGAALDALRQGMLEGDPFTLALIDAEPDGWTLADDLRHEPEVADIALVMLIDSGEPAHAARARALGRATHLMKPFGSEEVRAAVHAVLGDGSRMPTERHAGPVRSDEDRTVHVLLVEDEPVNRIVIFRLLERRGYRVTTVDDGVQALDLLARESVDLILMDVQMPRMDGLETTAAIRARPASGGDVPIVALTAHALVGDRERCLAAGMDAYLSKPVSPEELFATIEALLPHAAGKTNDTHMEDVMATAIDREEILGRLSGDRELIAEVVDLFVADRATLLGDLRRAVSDNDAKAAREAAHRLKGVLATLAARGAVSTAVKLEELARKGDLHAAPATLDTLEREVDVVQDELAKLVRDLAPNPAA